MTEKDTWGQDPQIRYMREVFAAIEKAQKTLLDAAGISPTDERLRRVREVALRFFEKAWMAAMQRGMGTGRQEATAIYIFCLSQALSMRGVHIPPASLPDSGELKKLVDEVLK